MRIMLLAADFPPSIGGIQTLLLEIFRRLPDEVVALAPGRDAPDPPARPPFQVVRVTPGTRLGLLGTLLMLVRALAYAVRRPPDLVVCGHVLTGPIGLVMQALFRCPYVVYTYAYEVRRKRWARLVSLVLRRADAVIAISVYTREAVERFGVPSSKIRVITPGVDATRFTPANGRAPAPRRPTLLTVARLNERYKGHDTVIRVLPLIRAKVPDVRYVVAGDGRLRDYLETLARNIGVSDAVVFAGSVADDALPDLYRTCDVFVLASRESRTGGGAEGFGIVCLEASASGKPVIAGRSGGLPDAVHEGVSGLLVDSEDLFELTDAVVQVLTDRTVAAALGESGRQWIVEGMTWDHVAVRCRALFAEVVARGTGRSVREAR